MFVYMCHNTIAIDITIRRSRRRRPRLYVPILYSRGFGFFFF